MAIDQKVINDLNKLEKEIATSKTSFSRLEGQEQSLLTQLKAEFGCANVVEAKALLAELEKEMVEKEDLIITKYNDLRTKYEW